MEKVNTTTDDVIFYTTQPTIIDRIKGWFQLRRYMKRFKAERAQRDVAIAQMMAERRVL